ncbi:MAG: methionyl-tRNA formyltransferase [Helicobacteraceae bacterium]|nr:methionyl-tRNA formyltransferase [Candidatus Sulfurimonas ponti]MBL6973267.1 methionyl-tRNA formyltransferase [Sulfurimonas sp.]
MKIIFMGTPDYAEAILKTLIDASDMEVVAVYTQPDKPVGRKKVMTSPPVKVLANENKIEVYQPNRLRDAEVVAELQKIECDYIVVAAYGQILPQEILDHAPCINLHASILPAYRGASPIQQTLLNDDKTTGVTAMRMDIGLDTGDILKIQTIDVGKDELVSSLFDRLTKVACDLTVDVLQNFDSLKPIPQNDSLSTHCTKITKANGEVNFEDAYSLYCKYRAYTPWPGIYLKNGLKLKEIKLLEKCTENEAGKILSIGKNSVVLGCAKGTIEVFNVQAPSKKEVDIISYINGKRLTLEDYLS